MSSTAVPALRGVGNGRRLVHAISCSRELPGNTGWDWASINPLLARIERTLDLVNPPLAPIQQAILDAAVAQGLSLNDDYNAGDQQGVSRIRLNLRDGKRLSTWSAYLKPVLGHPRLTIRVARRPAARVRSGRR